MFDTANSKCEETRFVHGLYPTLRTLPRMFGNVMTNEPIEELPLLLRILLLSTHIIVIS